MSEHMKPSPVDKLFSRLQLAYGRKWLSMWDGIEDEGAVKQEWNRRLAPFASPEGAAAIAWVLDHGLPVEWPPTSLEFVALVKGAMPRKVEAVPQLEAARVPAPERARELLAQLAVSVNAARPQQQSTVEKLQALAQSGARLNSFQRAVLRDELARQQRRQALSTPIAEAQGAAA